MKTNCVLTIAIVLLYQTLDERVVCVVHSTSLEPAKALLSRLSSWARSAKDLLPSVSDSYVIDDTVYEGDAVILVCQLEPFNFLLPNIEDLGWQWKPTRFETPRDDAIQITDEFQHGEGKFHIDTWANEYDKMEWKTFIYSHLYLPSVTKNVSGSYTCYNKLDLQPKQTFQVDIAQKHSKKKTSSLVIIKQMLNQTDTAMFDLVPFGKSFQLICKETVNASSNTTLLLRTTSPPDRDVYKDDNIYYQQNGVLNLWKWRVKENFPLAEERNKWLYSIDVQNASYLDTGGFKCDTNKNPHAAYHHIYVIDKMQKMLPPAEVNVYKGSKTNDATAVVVVYQSEEAHLGCAPTDPSVTIHLLDSERRKLASSSTGNSRFDIWRFNAYSGFTLTRPSWDVEGEYFCSTADRSQEKRFLIEVIGIQVYAAHGSAELMEFEKLVLTCQAKTIHSRGALLTWYWKPFDSTQDFTYVSPGRMRDWNCTRKDGDNSGIYFNNITCSKTPFEVSGFFECRDSVLNNNYSVPTAGYWLRVAKDSCDPSIEGERVEIHDNIDPSGSLTLRCVEKGSCPIAESRWYIVSLPQQEDAFRKDSDLTRGKERAPIVGKGGPYRGQGDQSQQYAVQKDAYLTRGKDLIPLIIGKGYVYQTQQYAVQEDRYSTRENGWIQQIIGNDKLYQIKVKEGSTELTIQKPDNYSAYMCVFLNGFRVAEKHFVVKVGDRQLSWETKAAIISVSSLVILLALPTALVFYVKYRHKKKIIRIGAVARNLTQLLEGSIGHINPDTPLDDQLEVLPYESQWEFPEESLFLEKQIGCGHFGRVVKARATGIVPSAPSETIEVAVKTVKSRSDLVELKSLVGELKILAHLGSHLNVVNLLGAVTKNIDKGTLMVIVEYCRNGNLKDYLVNNRSSFVNERDEEGIVKPQRASFRYYQSTNPAAQTAEKRRLHKKSFRKFDGEARSCVITTSDLIEWSFEIASGMNYLTQKKVIHGDLAARNVLLADDNVVKIADFGLARKFYQDSIYYKTGKEALPVKWMAIESIQDRVFSSKSDAWSFGVTLWELFSLGHEPYADIQSSNLLRILLTGYRLGKPELAPDVICDVMSSCWKANPEERSTFDHCEQTIGDLLHPDVLAMYKMSYDRFGYIHMPSDSNTTSELTPLSEDGQHEQVMDDDDTERHQYLQVKTSEELQSSTVCFV